MNIRRTGLDHLPAAMQRELESVVAVLFEEFELAAANATGKHTTGGILKVALYGSDRFGRHNAAAAVSVALHGVAQPANRKLGCSHGGSF